MKGGGRLRNAWRAGALAVAFLAPLGGHAAPPTVRTLFVGIDHYIHAYHAQPGAAPPNPDTVIVDLQGAVNDVVLMKKTLAKTYGLRVDDGAMRPGDPCDSTAISITLTDACATRDGILTSLEHLIEWSAPGDIVLFYYAGHGSWHQDDAKDHVNGMNSTLLPADGRRPVTDVPDILDVELKSRIDQAENRGVSVVTIFDSCHSGTATRDLGLARSAPAFKGALPAPKPLAPLAPVVVPATVHAYRVHLAAAADDESSNETVRAGVHHGIFTLALTDVLAERKGATYLDIAAETRRRLEESGHRPQLRLGNVLGTEKQNSQAEGALDAHFLGARPDPSRSYEAEAEAAGRIRIKAGTLSGVTPGSSYAIFPSSTVAAPDPAAEIGRGVVASADAESAELLAPISQPPPPKTPLFVRELVHDYGAQRLKVRIEGGNAGDRALVRRELEALGGDNSYVEIVETEPQFILSLAGGEAEFRNADGQSIVAAGPVSSAAFARRLGDATRAAANYFALLALRGGGGGDDEDTGVWGAIEFRKGGCAGRDCAFPRRGDEIVAKVGDAVDIYVKNRRGEGHDLYRYVLFLNAQTYEVTVLAPPGYSKDPPLQGGNKVEAFEGSLRRPGRGTVLLLLTERPINVAALRQDPVRDIGAASHGELELLLRNAGVGARGDTVVRTGDWQAIAATITVAP